MRVADDSFVFSDFNSSLVTDAVATKDIPVRCRSTRAMDAADECADAVLSLIVQVGPLRRLQNASGYSRTQRGIASAMLDGMTDALTQRNVTRSHLEHQVVASISLKSPTEYLYWCEVGCDNVAVEYGVSRVLMMMAIVVRMFNRIQAYARFLAQDEDVDRLDDLCADMMGPFHACVLGRDRCPMRRGVADIVLDVRLSAADRRCRRSTKRTDQQQARMTATSSGTPPCWCVLREC